MADIKKLLDALAPAASAAGYKFNPDRAVVTLEFVDAAGMATGQTLALSGLFAAEDPRTAVASILAGVKQHSDRIQKFDIETYMTSSAALQAELKVVRAQLAELQTKEDAIRAS